MEIGVTAKRILDENDANSQITAIRWVVKLQAEKDGKTFVNYYHSCEEPTDENIEWLKSLFIESLERYDAEAARLEMSNHLAKLLEELIHACKA